MQNRNSDEKSEQHVNETARFAHLAVDTVVDRFVHAGNGGHKMRIDLLKIGKEDASDRLRITERGTLNQNDIFAQPLKHVPHRKHAQDAVAGIQINSLLQFVELRQKIAVRKFDTLGHTRRTRRKDDARRIVPLAFFKFGFDFSPVFDIVLFTFVQ